MTYRVVVTLRGCTRNSSPNRASSGALAGGESISTNAAKPKLDKLLLNNNNTNINLNVNTTITRTIHSPPPHSVFITLAQPSRLMADCGLTHVCQHLRLTALRHTVNIPPEQFAYCMYKPSITATGTLMTSSEGTTSEFEFRPLFLDSY